MGDGDDSFAETVFNFFEILAATADESDPSYSSVVSLLNGYMPLMIDLVRSDRGTLFLPSPSHPPDFFIHQRGAASDEFGHLGGVFDEISADPSQTSPVIVASASLVTKKMYCMDALLSICTVFSFFSFLIMGSTSRSSATLTTPT